MNKRHLKQDLILFYENNDDDRLYSNSMVTLYMNRFIIDEESQHEVSGVYQLAAGRNDVIPPITKKSFTAALYRKVQTVVPAIIPWFRSKLQEDLKIIHDALIKDPSERKDSFE